MKIFLLERINKGEYDVVDGLVVRANSHFRARYIAHRHEPEGNVWLDPKQTTCCRIKEPGTEEIILIDFNNG